MTPSTKNPTHPSTLSKGFTLTELLVVIAIIAVLASIIFPISIRVRSKAQATTCGSNMRQIAALGQLFASEHNGKLPRLHVTNKISIQEGYIPEAIETKDRIANNPNVYFWQDLLSVYGDISSVCSCPTLKHPASSGPGGGRSDRYPLGIGINYGLIAPNYQDSKTGAITWSRNSNVIDPARTVWFTDSGGDVTGAWKDRSDQPNTGSGFFRGTNDSFQGIMPRHSGKLNVCFIDGHVAFVDPGEIDWGKRDTSGKFIGHSSF